MDDGRPLWRSLSVVSSLGALAVVVLADVVLRSLGGTPSDFSLFLGRLHPLAVHLPIGIVLLVGAAEAATLSPRLRPRVDPAIALALPVLVAATVGAFVFGHLLARAGDFAPKALLSHRRAELFAAIGICLCPVVWAYQARAETERARWAYRGVLGLTIAVLSLGAHFGGTLTRGESYLGRYAPGPLKGLLGGGGEPKPASSASARPKVSEPRLFTDVIQPILEARCTACHGAEKTKGGLRLDSLAAIGKGGEGGPALVPGDAKLSPLLVRIHLPKDDEDHMPPEDKPQPTPAEVAALSFWIERGGNDTLLVRDLLAPVDARSVLEGALSGAPKPAGTPGPTSPAPSAAPSAAPTGSASDATTPTAVAPADAADAVKTPTPGNAPTDTPARDPDPAPKEEPTPAATPASAGASTASGILAERCEKCHGASKQKGKLRVDSLDALLRGGKSGPAVVPGNPGKSALLSVIAKPLDDDKHMPPKKEPQLSAREIAVLTSWIRGLDAASQATASTSKPAPTSDSTRTPATSPAPAASPEPTPDTAASPPPATSAPPAAAASAPPAPAASPTPASPTTDPPSPDLLASLPSRLALYPTQIAPLLTEHCDMCHSGTAPSGGLSVETHAALLKGGDTGPAVIPGKPDESVLVQRIRLPAGDSDRMPPEGSAELTADDIALVTAWVQADGSASTEIDLKALPAGAVRAIAAHPPARAGEDVAKASPRVQGGGCGACVVSRREPEPSFAAYAASALWLGLAVRRQRRRRAA